MVVMKNPYSEYLARTESALNTVFPASADGPWISRVSGQPSMETSTSQVNIFLEPGHELLRRGGKRWRPLITILVCEALNGGRKADILTALTEIPHNGSLIIDDIEDESLVRRGGPALHLQFGTDLAVNAGNFMYFLPTIVFEHADFDTPVLLAMMKDWFTIMRRLHLGQGYDILWHKDHQLLPDRDSYLRMCRFKTGSLAALAARLGARAALSDRCDENLVEAMGEIWERIGVGFQILDDVKNLNSEIQGKHMGDDIVEGKKSLPVILHLEARPQDSEKLAELLTRSSDLAPKGDWSSVNETIALMRQSGAIDDACVQGKAMLNSGKNQLLALLPESLARNLLIDLVDGFLEKQNSGLA